MDSRRAAVNASKATYAERRERNLEGVGEKAAFGNWPGTKQQESQNLSEALEWCIKAGANEPSNHPGNSGLVSTPIKTV